MAQLIDGKAISAATRDALKEGVARLAARGITPGLAVVLVGEDPASRVYVNNKKKACAQLGIYSQEHLLPEETTTAQLLELVDRLNRQREIHGILVQLPLPAQIDADAVLAAIHPDKDVDAFHPYNVGRIMIGDYRFAPCTPAGVMELLDAAGIDPAGQECVIIGRSNIVGKPMSMLMLQRNATVTLCHSRTRNLAEVCRRAQILIVAIGRAKMVTADFVRPGAVVIDVGMNRDAEGRLCGDVDFESVEPLASYITPVPGGVGPMTITMLMKNTLAAAELAAARA